MYWFFKNIVVKPVLRLFFRARVIGAENVPATGAIIFASNHLSMIDSFFEPILVRRQITYLARSEFFAGKGLVGGFVRWFLVSTDMLPIDRSGGSASAASLQAGLKALDDGRMLGIYPEGTRSPDGRLHRGKTGMARLVLASGVSVIPVSISGTDAIMRPGSRVPHPARVTVTIGQPIPFERVEGTGHDISVLRGVTDTVMRAIQALGDQEYVDTYAPNSKQR